MVSRRNYITIAIMMFIILFMFQFTGVMKEALNDYGTNEYAETTGSGFNEVDMFKSTGKWDAQILSSEREYIIYIGASELDGIGKVVSWWCTYSKRNFLYCPSLKKCKISEENPPRALVIDGIMLKKPGIKIIGNIASQGVDIIFARMPDKELINGSEKLKKLLGIKETQGDIKLKGMHLFSGFLLGGDEIYEPADKEEEERRQDLDIVVPWYVTGEGTKTYMMGLIKQKEGLSEEEKIKNEELPAIIWRNSADKADVFCINGEYLGNMQGMGILSAIMSEISECEIYPVVNSRNLVIVNYPGFANENPEEIDRIYGQDIEAVFRDIVWPVLASMTEKSDNKLSIMMTPQFDYDDENEPSGRYIPFYYKLLKELYSEAGISLDPVFHIALNKKVGYDMQFWKSNALEYKFQSAFSNEMLRFYSLAGQDYGEGIYTFIYGGRKDNDEVISYANGDTVLLGATSNGYRHRYSDDIMLKSLETALGYSNIVLDLQRIAYPQGEEDEWQNFAKEMTSTIGTFWKKFLAFDATTVSESGQRARRFLAADFNKTIKKNGVKINIINFEEKMYFILRLDGKEVDSVEGGTFKEIEKGAYLIEADSPDVGIKWKDRTGKNLYYYGGK